MPSTQHKLVLDHYQTLPNPPWNTISDWETYKVSDSRLFDINGYAQEN